MPRLALYRWYKHIEVDLRLGSGYYCVGWVWKYAHRPVCYWSPDSFPVHEKARGLFLEYTHG